MTVNREVVRMVIRNLIESTENGHTGNLPGLERCGLMTLSPLEIEQVATRCVSLVKIDMPGLCREISQARKDSLVHDLVKAGASNQLLRNIFGTSIKDLTRLRRKAKTSNPGRPRRLSEAEETRVLHFCESTPIADESELRSAEWCLVAHQALHLPYMSLHAWATQRSGEKG